MKTSILSSWLILFVAVGLLAGCNGALLLPKGERLYNGAKLQVKTAGKNWETRRIEAALPKAIQLPRRNTKILWLRPGVAIHNTFYNPSKQRGFRNWIASQLGTPPVLFTEDIIETHQNALRNTAADFGFFEVDITSKKRGLWKKKKLKHTVLLLTPAKTLASVVFPPDTGQVERRLLELQKSSLLKAGAHFQLSDLGLERQRLVDSLRNEGWFYLSPDHLVFEADTLQSDRSVQLRLRFKQAVTAADKRRYRIGRIEVYPDHDARSEGSADQEILVVDSCKSFIFKESDLKKKVILDNIRFECGEYFSNEKYRESLFRLLNLQYFKFVNIRFEPSPTADSLLVARVLLTPVVPQKVETSFSGVFSPSYYFGVQSGVNWQHRNLFGSGEQLKIGWEGSLLRISDDVDGDYGLFTSDVNIQLTLPQQIPGLRTRQRNALTATRFSVKHQLYSWKFDLGNGDKLGINLHSLDGRGGFVWKKNRQGTVTHELTPIGASLQFSTFSVPGLKDLLLAEIPADKTGTYLQFASFLELRPGYVYQYDNRLGGLRDRYTYFRQVFALRANGYILPKEIAKAANLGLPLNLITESNFSQYWNVGNKTVLAWRLGGSAALPINGESYVNLFDLYTIGGASSVRSFAPRTIGPGATPASDDTGSIGTFDIAQHAGTMLLISSLELRQRLGKSWELAVFFDAGNVWLVQAPTAGQSLGAFDPARFYQEIAAGAGAGLRYNLGIFVLRLDLAFPVSKPYLPVGSRAIGQPGFGDAELRGNFAFGYPF